MYHARERFRVGVLVSPTMERQNESYLARAVRTERCNNAVWQRHMGRISVAAHSLNTQARGWRTPSNSSERYVPHEVFEQWPKESTPARGVSCFDPQRTLGRVIVGLTIRTRKATLAHAA